jgi:hypothetical protein
MKIRMKTWQLSLVLLLSVLLPVCSVIVLARVNNPIPHAQEHIAPEDFWPVSEMPVKVTEITKDTIYYEFQGSRTVILGSFALEERTRFPKDFKVGKVYLVHYCPIHKVAYIFADFKP